MAKHAINEEHNKYYKTLEAIRRSGICNMWGASGPLQKMHPELSHTEATDILLEWIENYNELNKKFGWQ